MLIVMHIVLVTLSPPLTLLLLRDLDTDPALILDPKPGACGHLMAEAANPTQALGRQPRPPSRPRTCGTP